MKFCKSCGANLLGVRKAMTTREINGATTQENAQKFDWSKTWVAEMMMSDTERERRREEIEHQRGIAPGSTQSQKEIKGGVITASVGVGLMIFLSIFMQGIIMSGVGPEAVPILSRVWIAGVIPFFVGVGLLINGLFVKSLKHGPAPPAFEREHQPLSLASGDTSQFNQAPSSVTEHTTRQLRDSDLE
jgi:hypothetical protein